MPGTPSSDVLTPRQLGFLAEHLPEPPHAPTGRPHYTNHELLPGILRVLRSGYRWRDLDRPGSPSGVTHWRRLRYWHRRKGYRRVWRTLLNFLVQGKRLDRSLISLDGTLIPSHEFREQTGYSGKHRVVGTKLPLLVDRAGTPLAVSVAPGNYHDGTLRFRRFVQEQGFRPIIPVRSCIPAEQAVGELYAEDAMLQKKRYVVERTIS